MRSCAEMRAQHRFDGKGDFDMKKIPMFDLLEGILSWWGGWGGGKGEGRGGGRGRGEGKWGQGKGGRGEACSVVTGLAS